MNLITWGEKKIQKFKVWDIVAFKAYLFSLGLVIGAYASGFVMDYAWLIWIIIIVSFVWLIYAMFGKK